MVIWNANGLSQHTLEVKSFLELYKIDILLISETHFTKKSHFKIDSYKLYHTMHPDGTAHGGSAILIKNNIRHHETANYCTNEIQATNLVIEDWTGPFTISAVYNPPKHNLKQDDYEKFFNTLGSRFVAGGDYNAKHTYWGSRTVTPKGRQLLRALEQLKLSCISSGEPTYWPTDVRKTPDLIDFAIVKGIAGSYFECKSMPELSSDHSPVEILLKRKITLTADVCRLHSRKTDWNSFRESISASINLQLPLKTNEDIEEAVEHFNSCIQKSAWHATPESSKTIPKSHSYPTNIRELVAKKRKARKLWQKTRHPTDKTALNSLTSQLRQLLSENRNQNVQAYLRDLDASAATDYSLWKATSKLKRPMLTRPPIRKADSSWAIKDSDKAQAFADHLNNVFVPNSDQGSTQTELVSRTLNETHQLDLPINSLSISEVNQAIRKLDLNKAPGYELITAKIMRELPEEGVRLLTYIYNAIFRTSAVPRQWKVAQIIMVPKPGKSPEDVKSYRPISLLPIPSKVMEILFLSRLSPIIKERSLIPDHQFGFRQQHGTIEQVHRLVNEINDAFERRQYCTAAFLDISQAFDRVWHDGLLFKIKKSVPIEYYNFIRSYLENRHFFVKHGEEVTTLCPIHAGVPQGSVMGPTLYLLYTADLPNSEATVTGTFADDTAILATDKLPEKATQKLQNSLDHIAKWLKDWRIKANESKSVQVTFTTRRDVCPPVTLNGVQVPQHDETKYLGVYLDKRLTWRKHIFTKRLAMGQQVRKMYWMLHKNSQLSMTNKLLIYKAIIKPIWCYGLQLWGTAANSNIEILQRFQSKMLRIVANAPWYVTNDRLHHDLNIKTVKEEIKERMIKYKTRITHHPNVLAKDLMNEIQMPRRLKRKSPQDLLL